MVGAQAVMVGDQVYYECTKCKAHYGIFENALMCCRYFGIGHKELKPGAIIGTFKDDTKHDPDEIWRITKEEQ